MNLDKIQEICNNITGSRLTHFVRCGDMLNIGMGELIEFKKDDQIGRYAFHFQCQWTIKSKDDFIVGSGDMYLPCDDLYDDTFNYKEFDFKNFDSDEMGNNRFDSISSEIVEEIEESEEGWIVSKVDINNFGDLTITFEDETILQTFVTTDCKSEFWRLLDYKTDEQYVVFDIE